MQMFRVPEDYRIKTGRMASNKEAGNNGAFRVPSQSRPCELLIIASDGLGWQHVSVHAESADEQDLLTPTWDEMCQIKQLFWDKNVCVVQYHPPRLAYINTHENALHLWRPIGREFPMPPTILV